MVAFMELGIQPELSNAVEQMGWSLPTNIQQEGIPAILSGHDVLMAAEAGSGKTGAFCLPIVQIIWKIMRDIQMRKHNALGIKKNWRMSTFDRDYSLRINEAGLICHSTHQRAWNGARCEIGIIGQGKYYYEAEIKTRGGLCRIGWATSDAKLNLGTDKKSFGFGGTGKKSNDNIFEDYGEAFTYRDVIGCFIDLNKATIHFSKNGREFPTAFTISLGIQNQAFFPIVLVKNSEVELNFGARPFEFPPRGGYIAVSRAPNTQNSPNSPNSRIVPETTPAKRPDNAPMCVIIEPTKELAQRTYDQIELFTKVLDAPKIKNALVSSALSVGEQVQQLEDGSDIITCTPGRIRDLVEQNIVSMSHVRLFVLDEADSLAAGQLESMGIIRELHSKIPRYSADNQRLQMVVVCSTTLQNPNVTKLAEQFMRFPQQIDLKGRDCVPDNVHQLVCLVDPKLDRSWVCMRKLEDAGIKTDGIHANDRIQRKSNDAEALSEAVKVLKLSYLSRAIEEYEMGKGIIFCRTNLDCDHCEKYLKTVGHSCVCLHGGRNPKERGNNLKKFREDEVKFLICTDVSALCLDVREVPYVFNFTLPPPEEKFNYARRIGRVGKAGLAISLVSTVSEKIWSHQCKGRGLGCRNTNLIEKSGCAKWFNETEALSTIEEHLGVAVPHVENNFPALDFECDEKVNHGRKRKNEEVAEYSHAVELTGVVHGFVSLEQEVQLTYSHLASKKAGTRDQ